MTISALSEEALQRVFSYAIVFVEVCGGLVVLVGVGRAIVGYVRSFVLDYRPAEINELRIMLGKSMVVALEFQVAADILKTGLSPSWGDILLLASIVGVRTVLNFLLERELEFLAEDHPLRVAREGRDD